ncbi:MAG: sensor domain-containing diguanylate cyclase [Candidatus Eisenbacteria bacterium]
MRKGEGIAGWVADQAQAVLIPDTENDRRFQSGFDAISGYRTRSIVAVPMRSRNRVVGVVELCNVLEEDACREDLPFPRSCATMPAWRSTTRGPTLRCSTSRRDPLTNLLNSTSFLKLLNDQIALAERDRSPLSVVFLDIDSFKQVVDTHGHLTASRVLAEIGHRIQRLLGPQQHAARFGGDEFSIVLLGASAETALAWGERLRASLRAEPYQLDLAGGIHVTASIGIATFPGDAASGEELLKAADAAMYRVKGNGKDACRSAR